MKPLKSYAKNSEKMSTTSVWLTQEQLEFVRDGNLNLSAIVRDAVSELMRAQVAQKVKAK